MRSKSLARRVLIIDICIIIFLFIGLAILIHQLMIWGVWFEVGDIHHESLALMAFGIGIGLAIAGVIITSKLKLPKGRRR